MRIALLLFPFALGGCLSMSSFQTAKTTKPGKVSAHVGLGSQGTKFSKKSEDKDEADLQKAIESLRVPILEGGLRVGLSDNFDIGGKLALLPGSVGLDMKYRLIGKGAGFGMATGIGGDYGSFTLTSGTADTEVSNEITIADVWVPLYLSLSFGKTSAIYLMLPAN